MCPLSKKAQQEAKYGNVSRNEALRAAMHNKGRLASLMGDRDIVPASPVGNGNAALMMRTYSQRSDVCHRAWS